MNSYIENFKNKKKAALILFSSPHNSGSTARLLNIFLDNLKGYDLKSVNLFKRNPKPCIDCRLCRRVQGCRFSDMDDIDMAFRQLDLIIIASPVYNRSFPAPLKAVLDRTQRYYSARFYMDIKPPLEKHKKIVLLTVSGSCDTEGPKIMKKQLEPIFTVINADLVGTVSWYNTDEKDDHNNKLYLNTRQKMINIISKL